MVHPVCAEADLAESVRATLCQPDGFPPVITGLPPVIMALGAVALISIAPLAVLPLLPNVDPTHRGAAQPLLLCFATGGMLGDVFLHILPETLGNQGPSHDHGGHDHDHGHEHHGHGHSDDHDHGGHDHSIAGSAGSLAVLGGFIAFFLVEKIVRHATPPRAHNPYPEPNPNPAPNPAGLSGSCPQSQALQRRRALAWRRLLAPPCSRAERGRGTRRGRGACEGCEEEGTLARALARARSCVAAARAATAQVQGNKGSCRPCRGRVGGGIS